MGAIIEGIIALIWVVVAVVIMVASLNFGSVVAGIVFLILAFASPYILDFFANIV